MEDIATTCGIKSKCAEVLWEKVKDNAKDRNRVLSVLCEHTVYYKAVYKIPDIRTRRYLMRLIMSEGDKVVAEQNYSYGTYLRNVLRVLYRTHIEKVQKEYNEKKLQPSRPKTQTF